MKDLLTFVAEARAAKINTWAKFLEAVKNNAVNEGFKFIGTVDLKDEDFKMPAPNTVMYIDVRNNYNQKGDNSSLFVHTKDGNGIAVVTWRVPYGKFGSSNLSEKRGHIYIAAATIQQTSESTYEFIAQKIYILDNDEFDSKQGATDPSNNFDPGDISAEQVNEILNRTTKLLNDKCVDSIFNKWFKTEKNSDGFEVLSPKSRRDTILYSDIVKE